MAQEPLEQAGLRGTTPFDRAARGALPVAFSAILIFLANLPVLPAIGIPATPNIALIVVFFWRMLAPTTMTHGAIFALGFLADGLSGAPLGLTSLALLVAAGLISFLRNSITLLPMGYFYLGFLVVLLAAEFCGWITASLYYGHPIAANALGVRIAMSLLLYLPLAFVLNVACYKYVITPTSEMRERARKKRNRPANARPRTSEAGRAREVRRNRG